jgi:WD40 repeat protein/tRNA A-37 threonylcarbamoyl transferase component Bud32
MSTVDEEPDKNKQQPTTVALDTTEDGLPESPGGVVVLPSTHGGRFVPLRHHARGGLGDVFVARDEELGREVALKTLQVRHADEPRTRARFVREAEITGHLEHPGIVPVYGLGRSPEGRPYYAMQFIQGESLDRAILRFHAAGGAERDPGERALGRLHLLGCFLAACNAVDFAHSRGIVHRDLKPSNIMLGHHGETLVVDWGLAKRVLIEEDWPSGLTPPPAPSAVTDSDLTLPGSTVGTPAFMSPEQAAGRLDDLGPASDVYNLGATLYCILTGRPPYLDEPAAEIFSKLERGVFPRPCAVSKEPIPRALEAICLKAMALAPEDRYASARALGEDIKRWIAHEPVSAYSESFGERLARWSRRHRTWVEAGTAAVLALLVTLALATVIVSRAWKLEQAERLESERLAARLELDKALGLSEAGATGREMLRLAHALEIAPPHATDLRTAILANLAAWRRPIIPLRDTLAHEGLVFAVACSPDGHTILTGSGHVVSGTLRGEAWLWNADTGQPLGAPLRHLAPVHSVAFSPDGRVVLTGSADGLAQLWNAASGEPLGSPLTHRAPVEEVAFLPDGQTIVTGGGHAVRFWSVATQQPLPSVPDHSAAVHALAVSPDGTRLVTGDEEGVARVWDTSNGKLAAPLLVHRSPIYSAAFSGDGKTILTGADDGIVHFWDAVSGQRHLMRLAHHSTVYGIALSGDGKRILTGSDDNTARLWDAATGQPVGAPLEHRGSVMAVAFRRDGKVLITGSGDATARLWGEPPGPPEKAVLDQPGRVQAAAFRPDGQVFVAGGSDRSAQLWDARTCRPLGPPLKHPDEVLEVAFSPDGKSILTGCADGKARLWDASAYESIGGPLEQLGAVAAVAFSPDGKTLLTGGEDMTARFWEAKTGKPLGDPLPQPTAVTALAFSPDGKTALVAAGTRARFWDVASRVARGAVMSHLGIITSVAFRADGRVALTTGEDNTARLWEVADGSARGAPIDHPGTVRAAAFSPDGQTIVTGCNDHKVRLWNAATGASIGPPLAHLGRVSAVAISADGRTILSGSFDQTVRLWDVPVPMKDDIKQIELWVQVLTGMTLDTGLNPSGSAQLLDDATWHDNRALLEKTGGPPVR